MMVVVADDLTGAAEIAGIGLAFGLSVELTTKANSLPGADLLVISADTRSLSEEDAVAKSVQVARYIQSLKPSFIYKKIDSVLRGHVLAEIEAYMQQLQLDTCLLLPGNPLLGRTIVNGQYFIKGVPVHQTSFAKDPEFAITDSGVLQMLKANKNSNVHLTRKEEELKGSGIFIGDVVDNDDLLLWSKKSNNRMLLVGAANFFEALLINKNLKKTKAGISSHQFNEKKLFVSGTTFGKSVTAVETLSRKTNIVCYMPEALLLENDHENELLNKWSANITNAIKKYKQAVIAFSHHYSIKNNLSPQKSASLMSLVVKMVLQKTDIEELIIEGGATAYAIMNELQLNYFKPLQQFAQGIIRMQAINKNNLFITMKPGSYDWPATVWNFKTIVKD